MLPANRRLLQKCGAEGLKPTLLVARFRQGRNAVEGQAERPAAKAARILEPSFRGLKAPAPSVGPGCGRCGNIFMNFHGPQAQPKTRLKSCPGYKTLGCALSQGMGPRPVTRHQTLSVCAAAECAKATADFRFRPCMASRYAAIRQPTFAERDWRSGGPTASRDNHGRGTEIGGGCQFPMGCDMVGASFFIPWRESGQENVAFYPNAILITTSSLSVS